MKGYPKSQFTLVDNTSIATIASEVSTTPTSIMMQTYTSDKGEEGWKLLFGLDSFIKSTGALSFEKHGQQQLTVAELLRSGSYVLGKRLVADDAALANVTIKAKVIKVNSKSYVYLYATSAEGAKDIEEAAIDGYDEFNGAAEPTQVDSLQSVGATEIDIPLFTIAAKGRGVSALSFRLAPEYYTSRASQSLKYSLEVIENSDILESLLCTLNPDVVVDNENVSLQNKVDGSSTQVNVKVFDDGILKLVQELSKTAVDGNGDAYSVADLFNLDFINGYTKKGDKPIAGIVTKTTSDGSDKSTWTEYKPAGINEFYSLDSEGIPLTNGTYGNLTATPMSQPEKLKELLLGAWGNNTESAQFDSSIYDLDNYKVDAIFDCAYPVDVKNAIINLVDAREDCVFICDLGTSCHTKEEILNEVEKINKSRFCAVYHNYFKVLNPYNKKHIEVTLPYLLAPKMVNHISKGVGRPFAGVTNGLIFPEIIKGSINFTPVKIPGEDQMQDLVDANVNYLKNYNEVPTLETMYVNTDSYTQLSFLQNVMAAQELVKVIRTRCPKNRYTFLDGQDLETYIDDVKAVVNEYKTNFKTVEVKYMADERYESNKIFYAVIQIQFKDFTQEENFKLIAIN